MCVADFLLRARSSARARPKIFWGLVAGALLVACENVVVSMVEVEVEVTPESMTLMLGGRSDTASAVVRESGGGELSGVSVTWTTDDPDVATVSSNGVVEARSKGMTRVRATSGGASGSAQVRVFGVPGSDPDDDEDDEDDEDDLASAECDLRDMTFAGDLEIPSHTSCVMTNVQVRGELTLGDNARLVASGLTVEKRLRANGAEDLALTASQVDGDFVFEKGGSVTIRDSYFGKKLELKSNAGAIALFGNTVEETLKLEGNRIGPFTLVDNASQALECKANDPAPTGTGNVADDERDQCAGL